MTILLAEIELRNTAGAVTMLRLCSGAGYNHPSAPGFYAGLLKDGAQWTRSCYRAGTTSGAVEVGVGGIIAVNADGQLDYLVNYGLAGGALTLKLLADEEADYSTALTIAVFTMEQAELSNEQVLFRVRDRLADLETTKLQANRYLGTTTTTGIEGGADLKGKVKPRAFGYCREISPALVNGAKLIYQANDGPIFGIPMVYDRGAALTPNMTDYTSQADMEANAPGLSEFRVWKAGGCFRLGAMPGDGLPAGQITCDVMVGTTAADRTTAQILKAMAIGAGIDPGQIVAADVAELDTDNAAVIGFFAETEVSARAAMEEVANSIGAWFGFDRLGQLRMRRFEAPGNSPVVSLRRIGQQDVPLGVYDLIDPQRRALEDPGRGVPTGTVTVSYQRCWTPATTDIAPIVTASRRAFLAEATRTATATDASVALQFKSAGTRGFDSLMDDATAAQAEADRLLAMHSLARSRYVTRTPFDLTFLEQVDLGSTVELRFDRFGLNAGKNFVVIAMRPVVASVIELDLWG
jgi:hypothetical protein